MAVTTRGLLPELLMTGLKVKFDEAASNVIKYRAKLFNVQSSDKATEENVGMTGLGLMRATGEGGKITYESIQKGYAQKYIHGKFALGVAITEEMRDDNQVNLMKKLIAYLATSREESKEFSAALVFALGFGSQTAGQGFNSTTFSAAGTTYLGSDAQPLFSDAHPISGDPARTAAGFSMGSTWSNKLTSALSENSIVDAYKLIRVTPNQKGLPARKHARILMVPPALEYHARQILDSSSTTNSTQANPYNSGVARLGGNERVELIVNDYLYDANDWFVGDVATNTEFQWYDRNDKGPDQTEEEKTHNTLIDVRSRWSCGFDDPRGWVGSTVG